jgi:hypothetical protein
MVLSKCKHEFTQWHTNPRTHVSQHPPNKDKRTPRSPSLPPLYNRIDKHSHSADHDFKCLSGGERITPSTGGESGSDPCEKDEIIGICESMGGFFGYPCDEGVRDK